MREKNLTSSKTANLKTEFGLLKIRTLNDSITNESHNVLWSNELNLKKKITLRVQSSCLTSTAFNAKICDCADQTKLAMKILQEIPNSLLLYIQDEGRGHGMLEKNNVMHYMNLGYDTFSAFEHRGLSPDIRNYETVFNCLDFIGLMTKEIDLLTNNPKKINAFESRGYKINRIPLQVEIHEDIKNYLTTKKEKLGHLIDI